MTVVDMAPVDHSTINKNIEAILQLEEDDERQLPLLHRISHKVGWFVGTTSFVIIEATFVLFWLSLNVVSDRPFDPYPFPLLSVVLSFEAVFLTSFVLIRQNTMDRQSQRRNHLDLQINLLAEKEATNVLKALHDIAAHFHIQLSSEGQSKELAQDTPVDRIAQDLRSKEKHS